MRPSTYISATFVALSFATPAAADGPPDVNGFPVDPSEIYGGEDTAPCGWPTTVSMLGSCTGTLVHPEVVIYAAHCGTNYGSVNLGETVNGPKRSVPTQWCKTFPGGGPQTGKDFAVCKLAQPQTDIPIVPILMGCEVDEYLQPGQQVTIVGFGQANTGPYGIKREVVTTINGFNQFNEIEIGGGGKDSCQGDSGGPVFVQVKDGSWRVFGITSYGGACGTGGVYSMMHNGMDWFEAETGVDLTPCTDAQGNWTPTPTCGGFPLDPGAGGGDWNNGCSGGPKNGPSTSCGDGFCTAADDMSPPVVAIDMPVDETELNAPNMMDNVPVTITATATDEPAKCAGPAEIRLVINGNEVGGGVDYAAPYEFVDVNFPTGIWEVSVRAIDYVNNQTDSEPRTLCINMPCPVDPTTSTSGGSGSDSDSDSGTAGNTGGDVTETAGNSSGNSSSPTSPGSATMTDPTGGMNEDDGCGCRSGHDPKTGSFLLLGLAALGLRRRRRAGRG